jgi:hypothetical protein
MNLEQLTAFCDPKRPQFAHPFTHGDHTYATNGVILIRVDRLPEVPFRAAAPTAASVLEVLSSPIHIVNAAAPGHPLPALPPLAGSKACDHCGCTGQCTCRHCEEEATYLQECRFCERGIIPEQPRSVDIGTQTFSHLYLHQLAGLPGLQIINGAHRHGSASLTFDGGCGALMPLRVPGIIKDPA